MLPEDIAQLLNAYYEATIACIHETDGTVMNLIGDAILAIWNAPQAQPDHRERACRAATALARKLVEFDTNQRNLQLRTRIGLHTGIVSVGNIGSASHFDYAAIGENVNLASRLEGLNKHLGTTILATREIQKPVEQRLANRFVGHFKFKGFDQVAGVYELFPVDPVVAPDENWKKTFAEGVHCFQRSAFVEAREKFNAALTVRPGDGPCKFYLQKIEEYLSAPPKSDWMGEIDMDAK
jgi:adenylate cyclase